MNTCNTCVRSLSACIKKSLWLNARNVNLVGYIMAPNSGEILQGASVTDESRSCLTPGLNSLVVAPEWLGCVYEGQ